MWTIGLRHHGGARDRSSHAGSSLISGHASSSLHVLVDQTSHRSDLSRHDSAQYDRAGLVERVRTEVSSQETEEGEEDMPIEFGKWTSTISCSSFDGIPTVTATEHKSMELAPTARGGVGMPENARGQWTFRLDQAKGIVSIGMVSLDVGIGMPFRKPDLKDMVWYYTSDGVLRNGARSVGRKGPAASTGDVVVMRLAHQQITFIVNDVPFSEPIPSVTGAPLFAAVQIYRKGDAISLIAERFDDTTRAHIKFFSWGSTSVIAQGAMKDHPAAELTRQRTLAVSCCDAPDVFGAVVPSARSAAIVADGSPCAFKVQIERCRAAVYIGLEQIAWRAGHDWWAPEAVGRVWYYASDGSLRTGDEVLDRSTVTYKEQKKEIKEGAVGSTVMGFGEGEAIYTPFIPALKMGDTVSLKLEKRTLTFAVNEKPVEGEIKGVAGRVRLAVQFESDGDSACILPR
eukprot:Tamp_14584.p1 GENE.Tamp_14584~~Tamp_14584.p1  ORF type:complete len:457 (+),score=69.76 Tamp_14584:128-1498(+)